MYNVKQTQSEINDLKEKLSIQQQKNQLNELSNEREGETGSILKNRGDSEFIHHLTKLPTQSSSNIYYLAYTTGQSQYIKIPRRRLDSDRSTPSSLDQVLPLCKHG